MKKRLLAVSAVAVFALTLCGCNKIEDKKVSTQNENIVENSATNVVEVTEPTLAERQRTVNTDKDFVFDDAGVLSDSDYNSLNERTAWLSKTFKINASVVITDDIGDKSPKDFAEEYYQKLYKGSNGVMFLVNNHTGKDYILRKGTPSLFIQNSSVDMIFSEISPMLVTNKYSDAIIKVLELLEMNLPEHAIDRTNKMTREDISAVNDILSSACGENEDISVIFIGDIGEKSVEEHAKEQAEKYFCENSDSVLMTVNVQTGECYICSQGAFEEIQNTQKNIYQLVMDCVVENNDEKSFNYDALADIFVKFIGR